MEIKYVILGSGRQGTAIAYDVAKNGEAASVVMCDQDIQDCARSSDSCQSDS